MRSGSTGDSLSVTIENALNNLDENINLQFYYAFDYHPYSEDFVYTDDPVLNYFKFIP